MSGRRLNALSSLALMDLRSDLKPVGLIGCEMVSCVISTGLLEEYGWQVRLQPASIRYPQHSENRHCATGRDRTAAGRAHCENVRFSPPVSPSERMNLDKCALPAN